MGGMGDMWSMMMGKGKDGKGKGKGKDTKGKTKIVSSGRIPDATGQYYLGHIKSLNLDKNFGFITCPELQSQHKNDIFFLPHLAAGKGHGDKVLFELAMNDKGQPQAMN